MLLQGSALNFRQGFQSLVVRKTLTKLCRAIFGEQSEHNPFSGLKSLTLIHLILDVLAPRLLGQEPQVLG